MVVASTPSSERNPEFARGHASYALGLLLLVGACNIIDRSIVGLLLQPIAFDQNAYAGKRHKIIERLDC